jgi:hypothetical protein
MGLLFGNPDEDWSRESEYEALSIVVEYSLTVLFVLKQLWNWLSRPITVITATASKFAS